MFILRIFIFTTLLLQSVIYAETYLPEEIETASININQRVDLSNLEYDDSPYAGRTNLGHIFIPFINLTTKSMELNAGGRYKHVYVQFDDDASPKKMYPYMNVVLHAGKNSDFIIGNFENLAPFPNTIYNEFLYFEERPVSSGLKYLFRSETLKCQLYIDWLEFDTKEHPEEFITGLVIQHNLFDFFYYKFYNHYHHKGGQLNKDTHPVRIEQDIATSPLLGFKVWKIYLEAGYYNSIFSQNFEPSTYGHAASGTIGFITEDLDLSYQCFLNKDYYHQDAHIFYTKRENILHRLRADYNIYNYKDVLDIQFCVNLYGIDPPGIDMRLFVKIDLCIFKYSKNSNKKETN